MMCGERSSGNRSSGNRSGLTVVVVAAAALVAMSAVCGGCLWIAIPSLAYQGYKYESGGHQDAQAKQHQSSQPAASDDIE
jgi:hypothetical protein